MTIVTRTQILFIFLKPDFLPKSIIHENFTHVHYASSHERNIHFMHFSDSL